MEHANGKKFGMNLKSLLMIHDRFVITLRRVKDKYMNLIYVQSCAVKCSFFFTEPPFSIKD